MKTLFCALLAALTFSSISAQITVGAKVYPAIAFNLDEVWNQMIINSGTQRDVILEAAVLSNQAEIVKLNSQVINLKNGTTLLNSTDIFVSDRWISEYNPYYNFINIYNTLPYGSYDICFKVIDATTTTELANQCNSLLLNPSNPPVLISPSNYEELYITLPLLSWFPPSPILSGYNILYDLKIVEVLTGQTPEDAIQNNNPLVYKTGLSTTLYQYEVSNIPLDYNKYYAWQVLAKNSVWIQDGVAPVSDQIAVSEVYVFILRQLPVANPDDCFHQPLEQINTSPVVANKKLRILFFNEDENADNLNYEVTDDSGNPVAISQTFTVERGSNKFIIDLDAVSAMQNNSIYTLTITVSANEKLYLKFKYTNQ